MAARDQIQPSPRQFSAPAQDKSVGAAIVLTFLFGPFGMFYTSVAGAFMMIVTGFVVGLLTFGVGLFVIWPITMVWAAVSASGKHQAFEAWRVNALVVGGPGAIASALPASLEMDQRRLGWH